MTASQPSNAGALRSGLYATGSYGLHHGRPGGVQRVWFCGGPLVERNGVPQDPCVHATRDDARRCRRSGGRAAQ